MKTHEKELFYKYVTSDTANAILTTQIIRWACPFTFNDPFDTQTEFQFDSFTNDKSLEYFTDVFVEQIYRDAKPTFVHSGTFNMAGLIMILREIRDIIPKEKLIEESIISLKEGANNIVDVIKSINKDWHEYISNSRVLCVSEEYDNLLMWAHYAEDHKGLVIELKCLPEKDSALCVAQPINYVDCMPIIATREDYIKDSLGLINLNKDKLFSDFAFTKSKHWSYEKEWRCFDLSHDKKTDSTNSYDTESLYSEEINAVYFGCKILESKKNSILEILNEERYKHVKIFEAVPDKKIFRLNFHQIR